MVSVQTALSPASPGWYKRTETTHTPEITTEQTDTDTHSTDEHTSDASVCSSEAYTNTELLFLYQHISTVTEQQLCTYVWITVWNLHKDEARKAHFIHSRTQERSFSNWWQPHVSEIVTVHTLRCVVCLSLNGYPWVGGANHPWHISKRKRI